MLNEFYIQVGFASNICCGGFEGQVGWCRGQLIDKWLSNGLL